VIVRVLNMRVQPGHVGQFNALMRRHIDELARQRGLEYVKLARRLEADGGQEVVLFEEWRDPDSMYAWVGHDLTRPRLPPGTREVITTLTVAHFEALDIMGSPEPPVDVERPALGSYRTPPATPGGASERPS
jgi:heme-degrading monooxygenase HmoA